MPRRLESPCRVSFARDDRRGTGSSDRRVESRGGRRETDLPGRCPPILVGDSDKGSRRVLMMALERCGFEVLEAAAGEEALALAEANPPALVIAESTLPRDNEFQTYVCEQGIPHIVTVTNDQGTVPPNVVAILEKPFSLTELLREVFRALRRGETPAAA